MLNEAPNRNDAMGIANNVRLTTMGTIQFSMAAVYLVITKQSRLTRDERKRHENSKGSCGRKINIALGKNEGYIPSSLGGRLISVGRQAVRQKFSRFYNFNSLSSKA